MTDALPDEIRLELIEAGDTPWPRDGGVRILEVDEDTWVELISRRRTFLALDDDDQEARTGDLLVLWPLGRRGAFSDPEMRLVTHVWRHDGIAPGWAIVSLRPVKLVAG
jgi:hypothetical protein